MAKYRLEIIIICIVVIALSVMYGASKHLFNFGGAPTLVVQEKAATIPPPVQSVVPTPSPQVPNPVVSETPQNQAAPEPEHISQPCLVLYDHVPLLDEAKVGAKKTSEISSGQIVHLEHAVQPDDKVEFYSLANLTTLRAGITDSKSPEAVKSGTARWIEASQCLLFDQQSIFDNYINSTSDISNVWSQEDKVQTPEVQKKIGEINGLPFLERALLNPDSEVMPWAANRYFAVTPTQDVWPNFFKILKLGKLSREVLFDPIRAAIENSSPPPSAQKFKAEFKMTLPEVQTNLLQNFCEVLILDQNSYLISIFDLLANDKKPSASWSAALECLGKFDTATQEVSMVVKHLKSNPFRSKIQSKENSEKMKAFFLAHETKK